MSSIMTNASAMTALKTLQATNKQLDVTQNRISTGYRVAQASDNAAYWSIATTMRSDNQALSTVQDSLGLGAATVDVAYTAMDSSLSYLNDIKSKLVAATASGVDKSKIQSQISQDQDALKNVSDSAAFSGSNWLSVDSSASDYEATKSVVSSFTRNADNSISLGKIDISLSDITLYDSSATGNGLLQGGTAGVGTSAAFTYTAGDQDDGGKISLAITVDGGSSQAVDVTVADHTNFTLDDLVSGINASLTGATASKSADGTKLVLTSATTGSTSSVEITGVTATKADTSASTATIGFTTIAEADGADTGGGINDIDITNASDSDIQGYIDRVNAAIENVTSAASTLGAVKSRISTQTDFVSNLMDAVDRGIGQLVDADMNQESTRLQALQVQQQLGIQALSIANGNAQSILSLFR